MPLSPVIRPRSLPAVPLKRLLCPGRQRYGSRSRMMDFQNLVAEIVALMAVAQDAPRITREMLEAAAKIAGLSFTPQEQESILARLNSGAGPLPGFDELRRTDLGNTQPAFVFNPALPGKPLPTERRPL